MMQALMRSNSGQPGSTELEELELARELLEIQSEEELDHFFPLLLPALKAAMPILSKVAGPLVKNLAGSLLGGGDGAEDSTEGGDGGASTGGGGGGGGIEQSARRRSRRRSRRRLRRRARTRAEFEHEQFIGKVIGGLFGEMAAESEEEEQFIGKLLGGLLGKRELETEEEEQFIGKLLGGLFGGRNREIQEQFLGGILGRILGGELETEEELGLLQAQRFIRLARNALRTAGLRLESMLRSGRRPSLPEAQRIVFRAIVSTTRHLTPESGEAHNAREYEFESHPGSHGNRGRWVRSGSRIIIDLPM